MYNTVTFDVLKGKTLTKIEGMEAGNDVVKFYCTDGSAYEMYHSQNCCESVTIEDVCGDVDDLIGSEILVADEIIHEGENPEGVEVPEYQDSFTWTFYKFATRKGYVDLRWYGESNGCYSESVYFRQIAFEPVKIFASIIDDANKYLVIHSGSRNLGVQVCNYWQEKAISRLTDDSEVRSELIARLKAEGRQREIGEALKQMKKPVIKNDLAYIEGGDLQGYLHDMANCQEYAMINRATMANIILTQLGIKKIAGHFTTIHNYIDINERIIRKGAIKAGWDKVLIPLNMRDGSLICRGKSNEDWLCSAPHGAGRIMSRAQAFKEVQMADFQKSMEGIYTTSVCEGTLDEAPQVYKSADIIRKDIEPTVEILKVIKPLWNFKAKTAERGMNRNLTE